HRYRTDKEFSKRVLGKYGKITDDELLEGAWQDYAPTIQKVPRPSLKAIQFLIETQFKDKTPLPKPESFVDTSVIDQLEKSGVIDVKGKTILPGLIDGHCHLLDFMGELYLHLGITTCPDITQNDDEWTLAQRDGTNLGKIRGPRIWSTGARLVGPPPPWALR